MAENDNSPPLPGAALRIFTGEHRLTQARRLHHRYRRDAFAQAGMTPEQLAEAKQYGRYSLACTLADKLLDLLFLTFAAVVLARPLDAWLQGSPLLERFCVPAAGRVLPAWSRCCTWAFRCRFPSMPATSLEHRFHLSTLSLGGWVRRYC